MRVRFSFFSLGFSFTEYVHVWIRVRVRVRVWVRECHHPVACGIALSDQHLLGCRHLILATLHPKVALVTVRIGVRVWIRVRVRIRVSVRVKGANCLHTLHNGNPNPPMDSMGYRYSCRKMATGGLT